MTVVQRKQESERTVHGENKMQISAEGLSLIKKFEGCPVDQDGNCYAYQDVVGVWTIAYGCLLYTSPSPRDAHESRMPSSA